MKRRIGFLIFSMILFLNNFPINADDVEFVAEGVTIYDYSCWDLIISEPFYNVENLPKKDFVYIDYMSYDKMIKIRDKIEEIIKKKENVDNYLNLPEIPKPLPEPRPKHYFYIITVTPNNIKNVKFEYNGVCMRSVISLEKSFTLDQLEEKGIKYFFAEDEVHKFYQAMQQFQRVIKEAVTELYQSEIWINIDENLIKKYEFKKDNLIWDNHLYNYIHVENLIGKTQGEIVCKNLGCSRSLEARYEDNPYWKFNPYKKEGWLEIFKVGRSIVISGKGVLENVLHLEWVRFDSYVLFKQIKRITLEQEKIIGEEFDKLKELTLMNPLFRICKKGFYRKDLERLDQKNYFLANSLPIAELFLLRSKNIVGDHNFKYEYLRKKNFEVRSDVEILVQKYEHLQTISILYITIIIAISSAIFSIYSWFSTRKTSKKINNLRDDITKIKTQLDQINQKLKKESLLNKLTKIINWFFRPR